MRNSKCPKEHRELCEKENERLEPLWEFDCPKGRRYYECLKFEEHVRLGYVPDDRRTAGKHQG